MVLGDPASGSPTCSLHAMRLVRPASVAMRSTSARRALPTPARVRAGSTVSSISAEWVLSVSGMVNSAMPATSSGVGVCVPSGTATSTMRRA